MREYWVYELRAGDWLYIGMTSNPRGRLAGHRRDIKHRYKPERWNRALREYPLPDDWKMTVVVGPLSAKSEAEFEEGRLHKELADHPRRLWDRCGDTLSDEHKDKLLGEKNPFYGKTHSSQTRANISMSLTGSSNPNYGKPGTRLGRSNSAQSRAKQKATKAAKRYAKKFFEWLEHSTQ